MSPSGAPTAAAAAAPFQVLHMSKTLSVVEQPGIECWWLQSERSRMLFGGSSPHSTKILLTA